jgi:hypothetical protein
MQPYTVEFAQRELTPQKGEIKIGKSSYRADISGSTGYVREREAGSSKKYRIEHVLGGKNVFRGKSGSTRRRAAFAISPGDRRGCPSTGKTRHTPSTPPATAAM